MSVDRQLLITFLTTVELGSFTEAAEVLHLAQSSISRQIAVLEKELEVPLFEREGKMKLTPAGQRLAVQARSYLALRQRLTEDCRAAETELKPLTVLSCSPGSSLLEPLLAPLMEEGVAPLLRLLQDRSLIPALRSGQADAVLTVGSVSADMTAFTLWEGALWICGRKDDSIFRDPHTDRLAGRTLLSGLSGDPDGPERLAAFSPGQLLESNHVSSRLPLLCAGGALTFLPPAEAAVLPPELALAPIDGDAPKACYRLVIAKDPTPAARLLMELIRKQ